MTHPGTITDAEAAQAWAGHRGLELLVLADLPLGQVALVLDILANNRNPGATDAIPQHVIRTLAAAERNKET
jgi:hypothetical protein